MDKKEIIIFGLVTIIALFVLFRSVTQQPEIILIETPAPVMKPAEPIKEIPQLPPEEPVAEIPPEAPFPAPEPIAPAGPSKAELMPIIVDFFVNAIQISDYNAYVFIPIKEDRIRTFAGKFGPYPKDYRDEIYVELCSHIRDRPDMAACEKVRELNYMGRYLTFVRGYPADEFIGNVAMKDFGAYYTVNSKEHGMLAKSPVAPIRIVKD